MAKVKWKDGGKWSEILQTWGDYQLVEEVAEVISKDISGGSSPATRKKRLDKFVAKDPKRVRIKLFFSTTKAVKSIELSLTNFQSKVGFSDCTQK